MTGLQKSLTFSMGWDVYYLHRHLLKGTVFECKFKLEVPDYWQWREFHQHKNTNTKGVVGRYTVLLIGVTGLGWNFFVVGVEGRGLDQANRRAVLPVFTCLLWDLLLFCE